MGLISYFKKRYYNSKLEKADRLMQEGRSSDAEQIYYNIADKQPFAISRLAEYYLSLAQNAKVSDIIDLFNKVVGLEKLGGSVYDASSYTIALSNMAKFIYSKADILFNARAFANSWKLLATLNRTNCKSNASQNLACEARMNLRFDDIRKTRVTDSSYSTFLNELKGEWNRGKRIQRMVKAAKDFCEEMITAKRFYVANDILSLISDGKIDNKQLDNAVQIVSGKDVEANITFRKNTVSKYGKSIIIRNGQSSLDSAYLFNICWNISKNAHFSLDILKSLKTKDAREAFANCIFSNHRNYLGNTQFFDGFTKWLSDNFDVEDVLKKLEKLHNYGYTVETLYVRKLHNWVSSLALDTQVNYLDHAQSLYPNSEIVIGDKLKCAKQYLSSKENDKAISVAKSIITKNVSACVVIANALCNKADNARNLDDKESLYNEATNTLSRISSAEASAAKTRINDSLSNLANKFYVDGQKEKAYILLHKLAQTGVESAVSMIALLRAGETKSVSEINDKLNEATNAIKELDEFKCQKLIADANYISLWKEKVSSIITLCKSKDNDSSIKTFEDQISDVRSVGFESEKETALIKPLVEALIKRKYLIARDCEQAKKLNLASDTYKEICSLEATRIPTTAALRFIICKLKMQDSQDILAHKDKIYKLIRKASNTFVDEKKEIAYRFALILLKAGEDNEALSVLNEFLPTEDYLKKACEQGSLIKAKAKLEDFNAKLQAVEDKTLSSDDALYFINHMLEYADVIRPILDLSRSTLTIYRNKLKNYAIFKLFDEERYDVAFEKMLKEHSDYLDDYTALRNIALVCLNMVESKQITRLNYKEVIAIWLTAIYQEELFIKSLDYTSWDDNFTFSLHGAYGHFNEGDHFDLPDNVNYDDSGDSSVVPIKDVQRALLDRFEAAISDNQEYHTFYNCQVDAMNAFINLNLDEKCRIVAPYLTQKDANIFREISAALEQDRAQEYDNWEEVISVGTIYNLTDSIYADYKLAKSYYETCIEAIDNKDTNSASLAFQKSRISLIGKFKKLLSAIVSRAKSAVSSFSPENKREFKAQFDLYFHICNGLNDNTVSFVFSNNTMSFIVGEVNEKRMKFAEASKYILSIYTLDSTNARVKDNLKTLFEMLCRETDNQSTTAVNNILAKVRTTDATFYRTLYQENEEAKVAKELNSIIDKLNNETISISSALEKIYELYIAHPNHTAICKNLAQLSAMCIVKDIIGDTYNSSKVENILDKIKNNKSSEFQRHSSEFVIAYNQIWSSLPNDAKLALSNVSLSYSLNSKGIALKSGLDLLRELGGISSNRNPLLGLF